MTWETAAASDLLVSQRAGYWGAAAGERDLDVRIIRNGDVKPGGDIRPEQLPLRSLRFVELDRARAVADDIVITTSGNCGEVAYVSAEPEEPTAASNFVRMLRVDRDRAVPRYLFHLLRSEHFRATAQRFTRGATIQNLSVQAALAAFGVPLPPLPEQRRIAAILDEADALRERAHQKLLQIAELRDTQVGAVFASAPRTGSLGDHLDRIESGTSPVCESRAADSDEWAVLKLGAITTGTYRPGENKAIKQGYAPRPELAVRPGDVLMSRKNTLEHVGASVYVGATPTRRLLPDLVFRLVPRDVSISRALQAYLSLPTSRSALANLAGGSANSMANISKARLMTLATPQITEPMVASIDGLMSQVDNARELASVERESLRELFASLQHRAFRGEL